MKKSVYSIYDKQAEIYGPLFLAHNDTMALRAYDDAALDPQSQLKKYPQDFKLTCLGHFDNKSGIITSEPARHVINSANSVVEQ